MITVVTVPSKKVTRIRRTGVILMTLTQTVHFTQALQFTELNDKENEWRPIYNAWETLQHP